MKMGRFVTELDLLTRTGVLPIVLCTMFLPELKAKRGGGELKRQLHQRA